MRLSLMGNINTTKLSTVLLDTAPSRCVLGAKLLTNGPRCRSASCISTGISPCIDYRGKQTKQRGLLSGFNKYSSRAMESCRNIMQNINSSMINTEFHTSTRLARKFSCICRRETEGTKRKDQTTPMWAIHHHQASGKEYLWTQSSTLSWALSSV